MEDNGNAVELLNFANDGQTRSTFRGIKGTPYVKLGNYILTPDSETTDSADRNVSSPEKLASIITWMTPKRPRIKGADFRKRRRINFDLPEDEEKAKE